MAAGGFSSGAEPRKARHVCAAIAFSVVFASGCATNGGPSIAEDCAKALVIPPLYPLCLVLVPALGVALGVTAAGAEIVAEKAKNMNNKYPGALVGHSKDHFGPMLPGEMYVKPRPEILLKVVADLSVNVDEEHRGVDPQIGSYTTTMDMDCAAEKVSFAGWQRFSEADLKGEELGYEPFDPRLTFSLKERHFADPLRKAVDIACKAIHR
jgi:hypothetical protein